MAQLFLIGRILVGCYYLLSAFNHFNALGPLAHHAALHAVPAPELAVVVAGGLLGIAGLCLLLGLYPEVGVAALVLFFVPVTFVMHAFWAERDAVMRQIELGNFGRNIALLGSSLMFLAVPQPWPVSVERRLRLPVRATV
jgi:putative oxidoreductase